jgi:chorismate synthase
VIDGVPPRLPITTEEIQFELDRRRPGQSIITTPRKEEDTCEILSGVFDGVSLGTPIAVLVKNKDQRSGDYSEMSVAYRPSHADATYDFKYGIRAVAGGGRSSARETIGRVAAGAVAKKLLKVVGGTEVSARSQWARAEHAWDNSRCLSNSSSITTGKTQLHAVSYSSSRYNHQVACISGV